MFPFVPRKVQLKAKHIPPASAALSAPNALPVPGPSSLTQSYRAPTPEPDPNLHDAKRREKGKDKSTDHGPSDQDLAILLTLSLSDHALWADVDLRRAVSAAQDGWFPLSFLVQHSPYLLHLHPNPPESTLIRATHTHASDLLEARILVTAPSKGAWYAKDPSSSNNHDSGGYQVRLKHSADALARVGNSARNEWEQRTVYVESVPHTHRTVPGIHRFLERLLPAASSTTIQAITLPPHHLDRPGRPPPKSRGFALVTFAETPDAARLVADWPWLPRRASESVAPYGPGATADGGIEKEKARSSHEVEDAIKFGFRTLPKARWDALKDEYLEYRQWLLDDIARADAEPRSRPSAALDDAQGAEAEPSQLPPKCGLTRTALDPAAPYPPGCLLFVRNVHPETNKTTLKALFATHAPAASSALDYVDYTKGMASCHIRLATPTHARALLAAFADRTLVQTQGLDDGAGSSPFPSASDPAPVPGTRPITVELVDGQREELYWAKVPEKVRREAVRKAIAVEVGVGVQVRDGEPGQGQGQGQGPEAGAGAEETQGKRPRKRRRKA